MTTAPQPGALASFALLLVSMLLSAQALAFDVGGFSYDVTGANTVEVTGRASGNTDTVIVIPSSVSDSGTIYAVTTIGVQAFLNTALTSVAFLGDFGAFSLDIFAANPDLETITYAQGATGWDAPLRTFTPDTGPTGGVTAEAAASSAATPVPTSPLWLLGIMAGLLSLVGIRKLRKP